MTVKKTVLILSLATGLSVGLLSGCDLPGNQAEPSPSPSAIVSSTGQSTTDADAQRTAAINNHLKALQEKRKALNAFVENIKVTKNGTKVANSVDYVNAQATVNDLASAYKTFKDSLNPEIQGEIKFDSFNSSIDSILKNDSQERKILDDLAEGYKLNPPEDTYNKKYNDAQKQLSQYTIGNQPIYRSTIDGKDGSDQRIATKNLLENILRVTEPLATLTINPNPSLNPINKDSNSPAQSLTSDELTSQLQKLKTDINRNNWIWPLLNILALLSVPISFIFLWNRMSGVLITYKTKKTTDLQKDEQKQILGELQAIKNTIDGVRERISWLHTLPFNKRQVNASEVKEMYDSVETLKSIFNELYSKIIISQSILVKTDEGEDEQEDDQEMLTFQEWLEQQLKSFKEEIITNVKSTSLDQNTQHTQIILSNQVSKIETIVSNLIKIEAIVNGLSTGKESTGLSQDKDKVRQLEIKIQKYKDERQNHLKTLKELTDERDQLKQNLEEQSQQVEQFSSGKVEQLRQENQQLSNSSQDLTTQLERVSTEKSELEQQCKTLNSQVEQLQQNKENLESTVTENDKEIQTLQTEIQTLQMEIERLRKRLKKEAIEPVDIPQWRNVINNYNQSPESIFNVPGVEKQGEVLEDEEKGLERRSNSSKPVVLISNPSPNGFYILSLGNDYLLFPKEHAIAESQKRTASALFDGYKSGNTNKFTLISPAQVTSIGNGMWQLKHRGQLEYP